jgi:diguanylate cyclase (GGDEF)-like protein
MLESFGNARGYPGITRNVQSMQYHRSQIQMHSLADPAGRVVRQSMLLREVLETVDFEVTRYVVVEDDAGRLVGVMSADEVSRRINAWNPVERSRWHDMPVEAALQGRLVRQRTSGTIDALTSSEHPAQLECTALTEAGDVVALHTADDVYVSWTTVQQALHDALIDPVTALPNRCVFDRRLREEYDRAHRLSHSLGLFLIDVDHFKDVNDVYGHAVGDVVLQQVGATLHSQLRSYDLLARYGGDELAAICCGCRPGEIGIPLSRLQSGIEDMTRQAGGARPPVTLSMGVAVVHSVELLAAPEEIIEFADECLYHAKRHGRNCAFRKELIAPRDRMAEPQLVTADEPAGYRSGSSPHPLQLASRGDR